MTSLLMSRGDTANFDVYVTHPITGDPVDIASADLEMNAALSFHDVERVFHVTTAGTADGDITPTPGQVGRALVALSPVATSDLPNTFTRLSFEVVCSIGGDRWTVDRGMLVIVPNVPVSA